MNLVRGQQQESDYSESSYRKFALSNFIRKAA
nr:MAG TPA: hypothetical protein [Caudoviricetes sp.]